MYETILVDKNDQIATVTLNRPAKLNAVSLRMKRELADALTAMQEDDDVRVVILTGAGRAFSSGIELTDAGIQSEEGITCLVGLETEQKMLELDKPLIAAINGYALGDGLQQAILCDILIASDRAVLGFIGARVASMCFVAVWSLPALVGLNKASELLFTCDQIDAQEALRIGLVNKVVAHEQLMPAAIEMAQKIKKSAPLSLKYTKRALRRGMLTEEVRKSLKEGFLTLLTSDDLEEARLAFAEKRQPIFKGR